MADMKALLITLIVAMVVVGCTSSTSTSTSTPVMTGAYSSLDVSDADVQVCANYAVSTQVPSGTVVLVEVLEAQRQVVAGMNYKLKLSILRRGIPETATTVVWSKLDGSKEVTSFESIR